MIHNMSNKINKNSTNRNNELEIDFNELILLIWTRRSLIGIITLLAAVLSIFYALSLPNIYTSKVLLAPANSSDSLYSKIGNLSSYANIAGVTLPSDRSTKSKEGIERIKSLEFFSTYFLPNIQIENLMAVKKWDSSSNKIIYDETIFKENTNKWIRSVSYPKTQIPSPQEAYQIYKKTIIVNVNKDSSFISISVKHHSPVIAKKWLDIIVNQINESMRKIDENIAKKSIAYLDEVSKTTNIQSLKDSITNLLEKQMQILMLTAANESYVFKILDSPVISEYKSEPNRALICILGTFLGMLLTILLVLIQSYYRKSSDI